MAVKVIKKAPAKKVVKHCVCEHCGCTLEYVPNDIKEYNGTDYSGGPDGYKWIVCAGCKKEVVLDSW